MFGRARGIASFRAVNKKPITSPHAGLLSGLLQRLFGYGKRPLETVEFYGITPYHCIDLYYVLWSSLLLSLARSGLSSPIIWPASMPNIYSTAWPPKREQGRIMTPKPRQLYSRPCNLYSIAIQNRASGHCRLTRSAPAMKDLSRALVLKCCHHIKELNEINRSPSMGVGCARSFSQ